MNNTEREMITAIFKSKKALCTSYDIGVPNCYTSHDNEADLFFIRGSGFCDEIEVKVSRSDLLADKNKRVCYRRLEADEWYWESDGVEFCPSTKPKYEALEDGDMMANYFWYAIKEGIGDITDIPKFCGLIVVKDNGQINIIKSPDRLHRGKITPEQKYKIAKKCCYRYWKSEFGISF